MTPYAAAKLVNEALRENNIDKTIPAQMMYNYTTAKIRQGKKPLIEVNEDGKINVESFTKWLSRYIEKQVALSYISA